MGRRLGVRNTPKPRIDVTAVCPTCTSEFTFSWSGWGKKQVYCSDACRYRASATRRGTKPAAYRTGCLVEGCSRPHEAHGYCSTHASRLRRHGDPGPVELYRKKERSPCSFEGCEQVATARGLCVGHYDQVKRGAELAPLRFQRKKKLVGPCTRPGCDGKSTGSGYCRKHYTAEQSMQAKYGLTWEGFDALWERAKGCCEICGTALDGQRYHIDHCHRAGSVRGLLCRGCNQGLGQFQDDIERLQAAITYLRA